MVARTYSAKPGEIERKWYVVDADGLVLGRLASVLAKRLRGKHKPAYTRHVNCGDHIIVINAEKVALTGRKREAKLYRWHTGYPGGLKERSAAQVLGGKHPERVIMKAVQRMLPRGPLGEQQLRNLRVYCGGEHPHRAQEPEVLDVAGMNPKNKRSP